MQFRDYWLQQRVKLNIYNQNLIYFFEVNEQISPYIFLVFTHVMRRPCWCTKQWQNGKFCIIIESNSQKTFFAVVLFTNMAAVTSRKNREFYKNSNFVNNHFPTII